MLYFIYQCKPLKIFSKTTEQNSWILHTNSPWARVIKVCSNGAATYIIFELIGKDIGKPLKTFSKTTHHNSKILYPNSPWICSIKV